MEKKMLSEERVDRLFHDTYSANEYYDHLIELGYETNDITVFLSKETKDKFYASNEHVEKNSDQALKGAGTGSAIGGVTGAVVGAIAAIGTSIVIPGLGLAIAGPIAAALAGAGAGGAGGAIIGALTNVGISDTASTEYAKYIEEGKIIISVEPKNTDHETTLVAYDNVLYRTPSRAL